MNPPFNDAERQNMSPDAARRRAHVGDAQTLPHWVAAAAGLLRLQGTLSLIWRADGLDAVRAALSGAFGDLAVREVYPRPGKPAIRVLVRAVKGGGAVAAALPGLTLADDEGRPSDAAEAVLRHGAALI
jgi:tRNA1(Val) A37 N6-methylase TrmN6